jgi:alginate O-acetyltransferase complex protein AlgJ
MPQPIFDPQTTPAPTSRATLAMRLYGAAMILLLVAGATAGITALTSGAGRQRLADTISLAAFLDGRLAQAVNHVMAHNLPFDPVLRAGGGIMRWVAFRSGGPQVSPGCANWLFLTIELRPWPDAARSMALRADAMQRIATQAARRGVAVVFALVPDKARVEAAERCGVPYAAQSAQRYAAFLTLAHARGVSVVDLLAAFRAAGDPRTLYYRTDTHWSQTGAALAAKAIAAAIPAHLLTPDLAFRTVAAAIAPRPGDLLRLMSLEHVRDGLGLRPRPDREATQTTTPVSAASDAAGLLGAAPAPQVVLLGSSFSLNGNFHGWLQQYLGTTVSQFAQQGGGFSSAARSYFTNAAWRDTPPKLIIWEIPERVVGQPLDPDEQAFVTSADPTGSAR